jgi:hypothetical protein
VIRIPAELWEAYLATSFRTRADGRDITIRHGQMTPLLDIALAKRDLTAWGFITACNPGSEPLPDDANAVRMTELREYLTRQGFEFAEGQGVPADAQWRPEPSLLVFGIDEAAARLVGVTSGQIAVVVGVAGGVARVVECANTRSQRRRLSDLFRAKQETVTHGVRPRCSGI